MVHPFWRGRSGMKIVSSRREQAKWVYNRRHFRGQKGNSDLFHVPKLELELDCAVPVQNDLSRVSTYILPFNYACWKTPNGPTQFAVHGCATFLLGLSEHGRRKFAANVR